MEISSKILGHDFDEESPLCARGFAISCSSISYKKSDGKIIHLFSSGEVVDLHLIKKLVRMKNVELLSESQVDYEFIKKGIDLLRNCSKEDEEQDEACSAFLRFISESYWKTDTASFLNLVCIVSSIFYDFDEKMTDKLLGHSLEDYKVGCIRATMSVIFLMAIGIRNNNFIQDIYRLSFLFDIGLDFSTSFSRDYNLSRMRGEFTHSSIDDYLKDNWNQHSENSVKIIQSNWNELFKTKGVSDLVKFHHENIYGKGSPYQLNFHEMSDLESLIALLGGLEALIYDADINSKESANLLKEVIGNKAREAGVLSPRLQFRITSALEGP